MTQHLQARVNPAQIVWMTLSSEMMDRDAGLRHSKARIATDLLRLSEMLIMARYLGADLDEMCATMPVNVRRELNMF